MEDRELKRNGSGYLDPTAHKAIKKVDNDAEKQERYHGEDYKRFNDLLDVVFTVCELSGFHIENRLVIKDKKTGKVWR